MRGNHFPGTSPTPAVEAQDVTKRFADHRALVRVNLSVGSGCVHGLLGANGAGKTTLLRVLLGLVRPDAGEVRFFGSRHDANRAPLPDGVAGFVEMPAFYPYLSGRQNLALLARLDRRHAANRDQNITRALEAVELVEESDRPAGTYSAGMRQRLGIAAALIRTPRVLIVDEPTSALDPESARALCDLLRRIAADGAAVLLSSHDLAEVDRLCSELTVLNRGRVVFSGAMVHLRSRTRGEVRLVRTSDDAASMALARGRVGLDVRRAAGGGLAVAADTRTLDAYAIALGVAGIAIRSLELQRPSLESLFVELTRDANGREAPMSQDIANIA